MCSNTKDIIYLPNRLVLFKIEGSVRKIIFNSTCVILEIIMVL